MQTAVNQNMSRGISAKSSAASSSKPANASVWWPAARFASGSVARQAISEGCCSIAVRIVATWSDSRFSRRRSATIWIA